MVEAKQAAAAFLSSQAVTPSPSTQHGRRSPLREVAPVHHHKASRPKQGHSAPPQSKAILRYAVLRRTQRPLLPGKAERRRPCAESSPGRSLRRWRSTRRLSSISAVCGGWNKGQPRCEDGLFKHRQARRSSSPKTILQCAWTTMSCRTDWNMRSEKRRRLLRGFL